MMHAYEIHNYHKTFWATIFAPDLREAFAIARALAPKHSHLYVQFVR